MRLVFLLLTVVFTGAFAQSTSWQNLPLINAQTGEMFTLADFEGQTVYVEPIATWCTNCRQQLGNVKKASAELGGKVAFIALSVETNLAPAELANYASEHGFDFTFAVMTPEILQALAGEFGQGIATPPATPHFVLYADGSTSGLMTGFRTPAAIVAAVKP